MKLIANIVIAFLSTSALTSCEEARDNEQHAPRPVLSMVAVETPAASLRLTGVVEARTETQLGFRILGRLISRNVSVGDLVNRGEIIAAIDPLSLELAVRSAQSDLSNAQAQKSNAQTTQQRQRALLATGGGTEAAYEQAEQGLRSATAAVAKAQASLDKAQEQLSYAQLRAEFDGVVTATSAEVGQVVSPGQSIATIARPDERDVVIDVPQSAATQLSMGAPFDVGLQLDPDIRAKGVVREIAPEADSKTRTQRTKISLSNPPDCWFPCGTEPVFPPRSEPPLTMVL